MEFVSYSCNSDNIRNERNCGFVLPTDKTVFHVIQVKNKFVALHIISNKVILSEMLSSE